MNEIFWTVHYNDGQRFSLSNSFKYSNIDREKMIAFDVWFGSRLVLRIDFNNDDCTADIEPKRLIWRKRQRMHTNGYEEIFYMAGWQRKVKGINIQSIAYITQDGAILMGGQFVERDIQSPIVPVEFETDLV